MFLKGISSNDLRSWVRAHAAVFEFEAKWLGPTFWPIPYETVSGGFGLSVFFRFS